MSETSQLRARFSRVLAALSKTERPEAVREELLDRCVRWATRVLEWNQRIDLTAARSHDELVDLLIADAVVVAELAGDAHDRWVDVGSGAGGPALGLALMLPGASFTLVEPKAKRVAFLRGVVGELGCEHVKVQRARSQELPNASFDSAISRATFAPSEWLDEGARLAERAVWVLLAQTDAPPASEFEPVIDRRYMWPLTGVERRVVLYARKVPAG
ncbi:MAG: 16S rRNA (guanine(527)-N(7))-methyltransferase RsmG [Myxococcota bacterium]